MWCFVFLKSTFLIVRLPHDRLRWISLLPSISEIALQVDLFLSGVGGGGIHTKQDVDVAGWTLSGFNNPGRRCEGFTIITGKGTIYTIDRFVGNQGH